MLLGLWEGLSSAGIRSLSVQGEMGGAKQGSPGKTPVKKLERIETRAGFTFLQDSNTKHSARATIEAYSGVTMTHSKSRFKFSSESKPGLEMCFHR